MKTTLLPLLALALAANSLPAQTFRPAIVNGAVLGGVAGAIIGNNSSGRHTGEGAVIGAIAGALLGSALDDERRPASVATAPTGQPAAYAYYSTAGVPLQTEPRVVYAQPPVANVIYVQPPAQTVFYAQPEPVCAPQPTTIIYYTSSEPRRQFVYAPVPVVIVQRPQPRGVLYQPASRVVYVTPARPSPASVIHYGSPAPRR